MATRRKRGPSNSPELPDSSPSPEEVIRWVRENILLLPIDDWTKNSKLAEFFAIFVGWGSAFDKIAERHKWTGIDKNRILAYHKAVFEKESKK